MATYKVIQDIEAEDKLVGPLSLRQFIYAGIAAFCIYLSVISFLKGAAFLLVIFLPPAAFCAFFAWPWTPDQPTEVWALARIRYLLKPRKRIWDQSGVKELVTITVPKKIEKIYTNGLSQNEVASRLSALADTIDSRGWVIKNANVNMSPSTTYGLPQADDSDRLIGYDAIPREVPTIDVAAADDIMDEQSNPLAQKFDQMITASSQNHRAQIIQQLQSTTPTSVPSQPAAATQPPNDYWFLHQPQAGAGTGAVDANPVMFANPQVLQPTAPVGVAVQPPAAGAVPGQLDEQSLSQQLKSAHEHNAVSRAYSHLKTIFPLGQAPAQPPAAEPLPVAAAAVPLVAPDAAVPAAIAQPATVPFASAVPEPAAPANPVPDPADAAILSLANNNDLNVATIAREAQKAREPKQLPTDEVVITLH